MVLFQHNNLKSMEWAAIRRELTKALQKVDEKIAAEGRTSQALAPHIKVQTVQTSIFEVALRIVEYFRPNEAAQASGQKVLAFFPGWDPRTWEIRHMLIALKTLAPSPDSPVAATYNSIAPFKLGPHNIKYRVVPDPERCPAYELPAQNTARESRDFRALADQSTLAGQLDRIVMLPAQAGIDDLADAWYGCVRQVVEGDRDPRTALNAATDRARRTLEVNLSRYG